MRGQKNERRIKSYHRQVWLYKGLAGFLLIAGLIVPAPALSAPFNSGSTGADGAFAPTTNTILTVSPGGVFHFTTVNIPAGVTVTFTPNSANTPVSILASGDVTIDGTISVNGRDGTSVDTPNLILPGSGGDGGPGGFAGGAGGLAPAFNGGPFLDPGYGLGPGGGRTQGGSSGCGGSFASNPYYCGAGLYGSVTLIPLIGGSGGAGGSGTYPGVTCTSTIGCNGGGGGGGGGAILIASSGMITINGSITANGGNGGNGYSASNIGGGGSGGGVRLIANTITGTGLITAKGGTNRNNDFGGYGRIRLEANTLSFSGTVTGATVSTPGLVNLSSVPALAITAVAGVSTPPAPSGSFDSPDITLPTNTANPVTVNLAASSIPPGTVVKVSVTQRNGIGATYNSTPLSGTEASSTATASVTLSTTMPNVIRAEATFAVQTASNPFPAYAGGEKVEKIRVASIWGGGSSLFLITDSGREISWE